MTTNIQLEHMASRYGVPNFKCIMNDEINEERVIPQEANWILNLEDSNTNGSHWVALLVRNDEKAYIDSFGCVPSMQVTAFLHKSPSKYMWNNKIIQNLASVQCGLFSLGAMIYAHHHRNMPLHECVDDYCDLFSDDTKKNDKIIKSFFQKLNSLKPEKIGTGFFDWFKNLFKPKATENVDPLLEYQQNLPPRLKSLDNQINHLEPVKKQDNQMESLETYKKNWEEYKAELSKKRELENKEKQIQDAERQKANEEFYKEYYKIIANNEKQSKKFDEIERRQKEKFERIDNASKVNLTEALQHYADNPDALKTYVDNPAYWVGGKLKVVDVADIVAQSYRTNKENLKNVGKYKVDKSLSGQRVQVYYDKTNKKAIVNHRGTSGLTDVFTDVKYALGDDLSSSKRLKHAKKIQQKAEDKYGASNIDTIGHSLGAKIARDVGKNTNSVIQINPAYNIPDSLKDGKSNEYTIKTSLDPVSFLQRKSSSKNITTVPSKTINLLKEHNSDNIRLLPSKMKVGKGLINNRWVERVKQYALNNNVSYKEALKSLKGTII